MRYWRTEEYLGGGFVFQRKVESGGDDALEYYHKDTEEWTHVEPSFRHNHGGTRASERIVHVSETDIDVEVSKEMLTKISESE